MGATAAVGRYGEDVAARHLAEAGWTIVERNWRCRDPELGGELDIVALDGQTLVAVEVKTRRSLRAGDPLEAVTPAKLRRLRRLASRWCAERGPSVAHLRLDVVAVTLPKRGAARVTHVVGVG